MSNPNCQFQGSPRAHLPQKQTVRWMGFLFQRVSVSFNQRGVPLRRERTLQPRGIVAVQMLSSCVSKFAEEHLPEVPMEQIGRGGGETALLRSVFVAFVNKQAKRRGSGAAPELILLASEARLLVEKKKKGDFGSVRGDSLEMWGKIVPTVQCLCKVLTRGSDELPCVSAGVGSAPGCCWQQGVGSPSRKISFRVG